MRPSATIKRGYRSSVQFLRRCPGKVPRGGTISSFDAREFEHPEPWSSHGTFPLNPRQGGWRHSSSTLYETLPLPHRSVRERYPVLARRFWRGRRRKFATATVFCNLDATPALLLFLLFLRNDAANCNKRERCQGCRRIRGFNRIHAIRAHPPHCLPHIHRTCLCRTRRARRRVPSPSAQGRAPKAGRSKQIGYQEIRPTSRPSSAPANSSRFPAIPSLPFAINERLIARCATVSSSPSLGVRSLAALDVE